MKFGQLVMGPAGCGKSTYCSLAKKHGDLSKRKVEVVNLDPACDSFDYEPIADIRDLITATDVMEDPTTALGPNGALMYCMKYLVDNPEWLQELLEGGDGDLVLFDCPGQLELYLRLEIMGGLCRLLESWGFRMTAVYAIDSSFLADTPKFVAGNLTALTCMVGLGIPHFGLLTKVDLLSKADKKGMDRLLNSTCEELVEEEDKASFWHKKYKNLTKKLAYLVDSTSTVGYIPLDISKEEDIERILMQIDIILGISEEADTRMKDYDFDDEQQKEDAE